jgi:hypothetical protein
MGSVGAGAQEHEELSVQATDHVALAAGGLRALVQRFDVPLFLRESGLAVLVDALRRHLEKQTQSTEESELLLAAEVEKGAAFFFFFRLYSGAM